MSEGHQISRRAFGADRRTTDCGRRPSCGLSPKPTRRRLVALWTTRRTRVWATPSAATDRRPQTTSGPLPHATARVPPAPPHTTRPPYVPGHGLSPRWSSGVAPCSSLFFRLWRSPNGPAPLGRGRCLCTAGCVWDGWGRRVSQASGGRAGDLTSERATQWRPRGVGGRHGSGGGAAQTKGA